MGPQKGLDMTDTHTHTFLTEFLFLKSDCLSVRVSHPMISILFSRSINWHIFLETLKNSKKLFIRNAENLLYLRALNFLISIFK